MESAVKYTDYTQVQKALTLVINEASLTDQIHTVHRNCLSVHSLTHQHYIVIMQCVNRSEYLFSH